MSRSTLLLLAAPLLILCVVVFSWPSAQVANDEDGYSAIFWAADYLTAQQNEDGGWSLDEGSDTTRGSRAAVGGALLRAQDITGSAKHLAAALHAAETLLQELTEDPGSAKALDGVFLEEVGRASGKAEYRIAARNTYAIRHRRFRWTDGKAAAEFFQKQHVPEAADPVLHKNVAIWRAMDDIELAILLDEVVFAEQMAGHLIKGLELDPGHPGGALAAGRAVEVLSTLPSRAMEARLEEWLGRLSRAQALPGIVGNSHPTEYVYSQDASHVLRAFASSRQNELWEAAREGSGFFIDRQLLGTNGSWESVLTLGDDNTSQANGPIGITADVLLALSRTRHTGVRQARLSI